MNDLVTWLRGQLDEDERVARSGAPGPWVYQDVDSVGGGRICDPTVAVAQLHYEQPGVVDPRIRRTVLSEEADGTGAHIARFNPARVLAEVAAKRRILDEYEAARSRYRALADARARSLALTKPAPSDEERRAMDMADAYARAICLLAVPLADRPGYDDEWRLAQAAKIGFTEIHAIGLSAGRFPVDLDAKLPAHLAAAMVGVSRQLVNYWRTSGKLQPIGTAGRSPLYRVGDLLEVERDMRRSSQSHRTMQA